MGPAGFEPATRIAPSGLKVRYLRPLDDEPLHLSLLSGLSLSIRTRPLLKLHTKIKKPRRSFGSAGFSLNSYFKIKPRRNLLYHHVLLCLQEAMTIRTIYRNKHVIHAYVVFWYIVAWFAFNRPVKKI